MGNWKYLHFAVLVAALVFMYGHFSTRYEATPWIYVLATLGWVIGTALGYYLFVYRLKFISTKPPVTKRVTGAQNRPKVVLKKKRHGKNS